MNNTIAAIATANGIGAISIVRISGPKSYEIAKRLTNKDFEPNVMRLSKVEFNGDLLDISLVVYFKAPHSFTGEDVVEFQCHGGIVVSKMILDAVISLGARYAMAGEFSKRAFLNNKIDLSQAQAIAKLIESKSEDSAKLLAKQLRGDLGKFVEKIREDLIEIMAYVEVNIDYAEEDLPQDLMDSIKKRLTNIQKLLKKSLNASKMRDSIFNGFKIAIIGKPNVGKSSLLNNLLSYKRAIVSDIAGTTRDTIEENIYIGSHIVKIVDTAGIRDKANDEIEKIGIDRSIESIKESDIVIAMFDNSREFDEEDEKIVSLLNEYKNQKDILVVLNKIDLKTQFDILKIDNFDIIKMTQIDFDSEKLINKLIEILDNKTSLEDNILISNLQVSAVEAAYNAIDNSFELLEWGDLELFSYNIQEAINEISKITREFEHDEMLDKMFSNFCVGK